MFPGEEERSARLANLYQMANWWPQGTPKGKTEPAAAPPAASAAPLVPAASVAEAPVPITSKTGVYSAETLRDLSKISEVNQKIFRRISAGVLHGVPPRSQLARVTRSCWPTGDRRVQHARRDGGGISFD